MAGYLDNHFLLICGVFSVLPVAMLLDIISLLSLLFAPSFLNILNPVVNNPRTGLSYHGSSRAGIEHFQNIFYAADTSRPNRFAPPVPYKPRAGSTVDTTVSGAWCP